MVPLLFYYRLAMIAAPKQWCRGYADKAGY
jgi:hypothetical protein